MSGRFVRASKFRHVYGQPVKREKYYDNIRLTKNGWDSNLVKVNPKYLSVNWDASGGGAFGVIPLSEVGKLPEVMPLFRGHTGPVLDTDWNPFDDDMVVSGSDDATIGIYKIPAGFSTRVEDPEEIQDIMPVKKLKGHSKKVGHVLFHPVAQDILASASGDFTVKIWNIDSEQCLTTLVHTDLITSMTFNEDGSLLATVTRNKQLRVWDIRENKIVSEGKAHNGAKSQRLCWLGGYDRIASTGFDRSDRQYALWNAHDIESGPIGGFQMNGTSSGICMPFFDEGTNMLYLIGKGDGNIQYYEYTADDDQLFPLSEYQSTEPQRGVAVLPRRALSVHNHEIHRVYKTINDTSVEPISFIVPRKAETFQDDVYPEARAGEAALSGEDWWSGKTSNPKVISMAAVFDGEAATPVVGVSKQSSKESLKESAPAPAPAKKENKEPKVEKPVPVAHSTPPAEKKNLDEILSGSGVDKLLDKANSQKDEKPKSLATDSWSDGDDDEPVRQVKAPAPSSSSSSSAAAAPRTEELKKEVPAAVSSPPISERSIKKEPGSESDQNSVGTRTPLEKPAASSSPNQTQETIDLTGEDEALVEKVDTLSSIVELLVKQLKERDDKIDRIEEKLDQLLKK